MDDRGILVGTDAKQEWMLAWWWENYKAHNDIPVAFADFGMTEKALDWCRERGQVFSPPSAPVASSAEVSLENQLRWETRIGKKVWTLRAAWFQKPQACLHSPFSQTLWLDLDCQVRGGLTPLFDSLNNNKELALVREVESIQKQALELESLLPGEIEYNSGVLAFCKNSLTIQYWCHLAQNESHNFIGDQNALSRAIFLLQPELSELSSFYNYNPNLGDNASVIIMHYYGLWKLTVPTLQRHCPWTLSFLHDVYGLDITS